jgi:hypothetical protein
MLRFGLLFIYIASFATARPADEAWKTKRVADWTEQETKAVLNNSPWAMMTTPAVKKEEKKSHGSGGVGIPGIGRRRSEPTQQAPDSAPAGSDSAQSLNIRWESALPIREAELKARETNAPAIDEEHYAIAVYGLPSRLAKDPKGEGDRLKGQASLKREGQKDLKPSHVDVIQRDDGVVAVFLFPRNKEITVQDSRVEFDALIGQYQISQSFQIDQMMYQGKLEL